MRQRSKALRQDMKAGTLSIIEAAQYLASEYAWAENAAHSQSVGDEAKVRSHAADPTGSVALDGYLERSDRDREQRGKAALRRQMDRSRKEALLAIAKCAGIIDGEARKLEKAMAHLKPGPSTKNPKFEKPIVGDTTLGRVEMIQTLEAQARRIERGENYGG